MVVPAAFKCQYIIGTMVYMGGKGRYNASRSNQTTHFGIMGGLAPMTNVAAGARMFRLRRARNRQTIPLLPIPGRAYMVAHNILSKNPEGAGGVGRTNLLVEREMGPIDPEPEPEGLMLKSSGAPAGTFIPEPSVMCKQFCKGLNPSLCEEGGSFNMNDCIAKRVQTPGGNDWDNMLKELVMAQVLYSVPREFLLNAYRPPDKEHMYPRRNYAASLSFFGNNDRGGDYKRNAFVYVTVPPSNTFERVKVEGPFYMISWYSINSPKKQEGWAIAEWQPGEVPWNVHYLVYPNTLGGTRAYGYDLYRPREVQLPVFTPAPDDWSCRAEKAGGRPPGSYELLAKINSSSSSRAGTYLQPNSPEVYYFPRSEDGFGYAAKSAWRTTGKAHAESIHEALYPAGGNPNPYTFKVIGGYKAISAADYFWVALGDARMGKSKKNTTVCDNEDASASSEECNTNQSCGVCQGANLAGIRRDTCIGMCSKRGGFDPFLGMGLVFKIHPDDVKIGSATRSDAGTGSGVGKDVAPHWITVENGGVPSKEASAGQGRLFVAPTQQPGNKAGYFPAFRFWFGATEVPSSTWAEGSSTLFVNMTLPVYNNQGYPGGSSPFSSCTWRPRSCGARNQSGGYDGAYPPPSSLINLPGSFIDNTLWRAYGGGGSSPPLDLKDHPFNMSANGWTVAHQPGTDDDATAIRINGVPTWEGGSTGASFAPGVSLITAWTETKPKSQFACGRGCHGIEGVKNGEDPIACWQDAKGPLPGSKDCPASWIVLTTPRYAQVRYILVSSGACALPPRGCDGYDKERCIQTKWCTEAGRVGGKIPPWPGNRD